MAQSDASQLRWSGVLQDDLIIRMFIDITQLIVFRGNALAQSRILSSSWALRVDPSLSLVSKNVHHRYVEWGADQNSQVRCRCHRVG
jgi:hypothetical protein